MFHDPTIVPFLGAFLFVFAVVFGLLSMAKGKDEKALFRNNVNAIIAIAFAAFSVMYEPLVTGLQQFIPLAAGILLVLFFVVFIKRVFGGKKGDKFDALPFVVVISLLLAILSIFWGSLGFSVAGLSSTNVLWLIGIGVVIAILYASYRHS